MKKVVAKVFFVALTLAMASGLSSCTTSSEGDVVETVVYTSPAKSTVDPYFIGDWDVAGYSSRESIISRTLQGIIRIGPDNANQKVNGGDWRQEPFLIVAIKSRIAFGPFSGFPIIVDDNNFYSVLQDYSEGAPKDEDGMFGVMYLTRRR